MHRSIANNMKLYLSFLLVVVVAVALIEAMPADSKDKKCVKTCEARNEPVCAGNGKDKPRQFNNKCSLDQHNCQHGQNLQVLKSEQCKNTAGISFTV